MWASQAEDSDLAGFVVLVGIDPDVVLLVLLPVAKKSVSGVRIMIHVTALFSLYRLRLVSQSQEGSNRNTDHSHA